MADGPAGAAADATITEAADTTSGADHGAAVFPPQPSPDECHVWAATVPDLQAAHQYLLSLLDPAERARASQYRSGQAARRFAASRAAQRILAGRYLGREPASVTIDRRCPHCGDPSHGRPVIAGVGGTGGGQHWPRGLEFSVTHSGELLLLAYVTRGLVGIDAERANRPVRTAPLARYALSPAEAALVTGASGERQRTVFCRLWTRKEAVLKLTGHGLSLPLRSVDVTADTLPAGPMAGRRGWPAEPIRLADLDLGGVTPGTAGEYAAAIAATGPARRVTIRPAAGFLIPPIPPGSPAHRQLPAG